MDRIYSSNPEDFDNLDDEVVLAREEAREIEEDRAEATREAGQVDIRVENHYSIILVRPITTLGSDWLEEHIDEGASWFGPSLVVEPRYLDNLVAGMRADGLVVA
jgi:hypothetical protein